MTLNARKCAGVAVGQSARGISLVAFAARDRAVFGECANGETAIVPLKGGGLPPHRSMTAIAGHIQLSVVNGRFSRTGNIFGMARPAIGGHLFEFTAVRIPVAFGARNGGVSTNQRESTSVVSGQYRGKRILKTAFVVTFLAVTAQTAPVHIGMASLAGEGQGIINTGFVATGARDLPVPAFQGKSRVVVVEAHVGKAGFVVAGGTIGSAAFLWNPARWHLPQILLCSGVGCIVKRRVRAALHRRRLLERTLVFVLVTQIAIGDRGPISEGGEAIGQFHPGVTSGAFDRCMLAFQWKRAECRIVMIKPGWREPVHIMTVPALLAGGQILKLTGVLIGVAVDAVVMGHGPVSDKLAVQICFGFVALGAGHLFMPSFQCVLAVPGMLPAGRVDFPRGFYVARRAFLFAELTPVGRLVTAAAVIRGYPGSHSPGRAYPVGGKTIQLAGGILANRGTHFIQVTVGAGNRLMGH